MEFQIRLPKIMPLEQQRRFGNRGDSVGITVAHVQAGRVTSLSKPVKSFLSSVIMPFTEVDRSHIWQVNKLFDDRPGVRKVFTRQHHTRLEKGRPTDQDFFSTDK